MSGCNFFASDALCRIRLGIAADKEHFQTHLAESRSEIARNGRFADATFTVERNFYCLHFSSQIKKLSSNR